MKKKVLIIISIILLVLFVLGLITSFKDNARVRAGKEPKYTIKTISYHGDKVTYWGLGYKVIRYVGVSPNEPYENNLGVKYGGWFMKYELEDDNKQTLNPTEVNDYIINYFENNTNSNLSYNYVDTENSKVIVGLLDNSKEKQEEFIYDVFTKCCGSIYIKNLKEQNIIIFEQGEHLKDLKKIHEEINNKIDELDYHNVSSTGINQTNTKIIVELVNNSEEEQDYFCKNIYDCNFVEFKQGGPYTTSN